MIYKLACECTQINYVEAKSTSFEWECIKCLNISESSIPTTEKGEIITDTSKAEAILAVDKASLDPATAEKVEPAVEKEAPPQEPK